MATCHPLLHCLVVFLKALSLAHFFSSCIPLLSAQFCLLHLLITTSTLTTPSSSFLFHPLTLLTLLFNFNLSSPRFLLGCLPTCCHLTHPKLNSWSLVFPDNLLNLTIHPLPLETLSFNLSLMLVISASSLIIN